MCFSATRHETPGLIFSRYVRRKISKTSFLLNVEGESHIPSKISHQRMRARPRHLQIGMRLDKPVMIMDHAGSSNSRAMTQTQNHQHRHNITRPTPRSSEAHELVTNSLPFMELTSSLSSSQRPSTVPCPESDESRVNRCKLHI